MSSLKIDTNGRVIDPQPMGHLAWEAWQKWVDQMHGNKGANKDFMELWYPEQDKELNPVKNELRLYAKTVVQQAFINGYEEGFADRLLRGESK